MATKILDGVKQAQVARKMNLAEWRSARLHETDLPSGLHVTLRDATMTDLMLTGKLPASFIDLAQDAASKGNSMDLKEIAKNAVDFKTMLNALAEIALVEPQIGAVADETHITLLELPNDDKMAIFNFVNREVTAMQSFRDGENKPVAAV